MSFTCKHDFINAEHLSSFLNYILMVMVLRYFFFDVNPGHITQLADEAEEKRKKGDPQEKRPSSEGENCHTRKQFTKRISKLTLFFCDYLNSLQVSQFEVSFTLCVIVNIPLLVQFGY